MANTVVGYEIVQGRFCRFLFDELVELLAIFIGKEDRTRLRRTGVYVADSIEFLIRARELVFFDFLT